MSILTIEYGGIKPSDFSYKANSTIAEGTFATLSGNKELDTFSEGAPVIGMFLESSGDEPNPERKIQWITGTFIVRTDTLAGTLANYTVSNPVYADAVTGKITYTSNAEANPLVGYVISKDASAITVILTLRLPSNFPEFLLDITATAAELNKLDGATLSTAELNILHGVTATKDELNLVDGIPGAIAFTIAAGGANVCEVTIQAKDAAGTNIARPVPLLVWLSDAATGAGLTGTTASGTVQAKAASGADFGVLTAKKALIAQTLANGSYILEITDTAKTGFYVGCEVLGDGLARGVSRQLVTGDYGA